MDKSLLLNYVLIGLLGIIFLRVLRLLASEFHRKFERIYSVLFFILFCTFSYFSPEVIIKDKPIDCQKIQSVGACVGTQCAVRYRDGRAGLTVLPIAGELRCRKTVEQWVWE